MFSVRRVGSVAKPRRRLAHRRRSSKRPAWRDSALRHDSARGLLVLFESLEQPAEGLVDLAELVGLDAFEDAPLNLIV